jgi:hypothetical protein
VKELNDIRAGKTRAVLDDTCWIYFPIGSQPKVCSFVWKVCHILAHTKVSSIGPSACVGG